jgi:hypothetical protein
MLRTKVLAVSVSMLLLLGITPIARGVTYEAHLVYLAGTALATKSATSFQNDWTPIANSLKVSQRLNVPVSRQVVINYTNGNSVARNSSNPANEKPQVMSSFNSKSPSPISGCMVTGGRTLITDAWAHALTTAWAIHYYVIANTTAAKAPKVLLIGHSQGGTIARILQLVAAGRSGLPSNLAPKCWPIKTLTSSIVGIVGMGSPLSKANSCPGFPAGVFPQERLYTHNGASYSAGKVLMIGATPLEEVYLGPAIPKISNECATNVISNDSIRVNIFSLGYPLGIQTVVVGSSYRSGGLDYRNATLTTKDLHNLKKGDSFAIVGARPSYWNKTWKVSSVIGTTQRTIVFQVPASNSSGPSADSPSAGRACDVNPNTPNDLCLVHKQVQSHGWWVEGGGACPAASIKPGRGDGNAPTPFCGFVEIVNNSTSVWPTAFKLINDLTSSGNPGKVYDLIASKTKSWLP